MHKMWWGIFLVLNGTVVLASACTDSRDPSHPFTIPPPSADTHDLGLCGHDGYVCQDSLTAAQKDHIQYVIWAINDDDNGHCEAMHDSLEYALNNDRIVVFQDGAPTPGWWDPEDNVIGLIENLFANWDDLVATTFEEGDHYGNRHIHKGDENTMGWPEFEPKHFNDLPNDFSADEDPGCANY